MSIMYKVMCPVTRDDKTIWLRMGTGFENRDGSKTLYLDAYPQNGKLWIREMDESDRRPTPGSTPDKRSVNETAP